MLPKVEFLTGQAGTGKTTELKKRIHSKDPLTKRHYGTLCATTGIAAVNLSGGANESVTTINSELKYFDTEALEEQYASGKLQRSLLKVMSRGANLCIDEISMMEARQLDIIYQALTEINQLSLVQDKGGLGLILTGDFCQLPPVKGDYCFKSQSWKYFAENITRLTRVWRQENVDFLNSVNAAREGDGVKCAEILQDLDNSDKIFHNQLNMDFEGTTILPANVDVDRFNMVRLLKLLQYKRKITFSNSRWGEQRSEWKLIPDELTITEDSYVMILSNDSPDFTYANGDCGHILEGEEQAGKVVVRLKRNNAEVNVKQITRVISQKEPPQGKSDKDIQFLDKKEFREQLKYKHAISDGGRLSDFSYLTPEDVEHNHKVYLQDLTSKHKLEGQAYFDYETNKWITGGITYTPIRLAYASTCHKTQGLTLDVVQIDPHKKFFGHGSMMYVALSRVRSHKGLRIVGSGKLLVERVNIVEDVLRWI